MAKSVTVGADTKADAKIDTKTNAKTAKKSGELNEEFEPEPTEFDGEEEVVAPPRANQKDPTIRRKIEDRLERRRLREELGIYDDEAWEGL